MKKHATLIGKQNLGKLFTASVIISLGILCAIVLLTAFAHTIAPYDPNKISLADSLQQPSLQHLLGTDKSGRDIFSRVLYGGQTTLLSAIGVVLISIVVGVPLGLISGYYGGKIDSIIMRVWDVILAFPTLLLAVIFVAAFGKGISNAILAIGIVYIPMLSRLTRSLALTEKNKVYVEAARSIGYSHTRILFRHILPNCVSTLLAQLTLDLGYAILDLAALSFLGLGVQPPTSDWGAMLQDGMMYFTIHPMLTLAPGGAIVLTVVSFNILSDGIQSYLDPMLKNLPSFKKIRKLAGVQNG